MYLVYLSVADRHIYEWAKTSTRDKETAKAAFRELIGYDFLNRQPYQVTLLCNGDLVAQHRFDSPLGTQYDWSVRGLPMDAECPENG